MAVSELLDVLGGLANWPEAPRGRNGPVRRGVDVATVAAIVLGAAASGAALLVGAFGAADWPSFLEFATSVFVLDLVAVIALLVLYFLASLIAVLIDRLISSQ